MRGTPLQVHTHPSTSSFSGQDLRFAQGLGAPEYHVIDPKYRYIITPKGESWDPRLGEMWLVESHRRGIRRLQKEYKVLIEQGWDKDDAIAFLTHRYNTRFFAKYGIKYSREEF